MRNWLLKLISAEIILFALVTASHTSIAGSLEPPGPPAPTRSTPPSWDKQLHNAARFQLIWNDAAVLDAETGLIWERTPVFSNGYGDNDAYLRCAMLTIDGRRGFHLPSAGELSSLIDSASNSPALPLGHPFIITAPNSYLITSSQYRDNIPTSKPIRTVFIRLSNGEAAYDIYYSTSRGIWCVRGPE